MLGFSLLFLYLPLHSSTLTCLTLNDGILWCLLIVIAGIASLGLLMFRWLSSILAWRLRLLRYHTYLSSLRWDSVARLVSYLSLVAHNWLDCFTFNLVIAIGLLWLFTLCVFIRVFLRFLRFIFTDFIAILSYLLILFIVFVGFHLTLSLFFTILFAILWFSGFSRFLMFFFIFLFVYFTSFSLFAFFFIFILFLLSFGSLWLFLGYFSFSLGIFVRFLGLGIDFSLTLVRIFFIVLGVSLGLNDNNGD